MKKTTRKTCALGGFEVLRPWTFQEILVVRSQTYEFNGIIMPFLDGKLQPRCRSTRLRNALLGWSLFQACELGHPTTAVAKKNSFSMRAKGAKSFSSPAQKKNTHTRSKIRLVAGVEKIFKYVQFKLILSMAMKGDAFVYVAMITMKKNWQTAIWPLCVGPRGAIQQQGSSLWAPFNDLAIWPMSLQWLVLFSNDLVMIYICMYVCMHACMYVCMHVCMHAWMYVCMNVCMHGTMRSIVSENVGKKWKVAEIENLPKLKGGGGWNWNNFKKCLGVPPLKFQEIGRGYAKT